MQEFSVSGMNCAACSAQVEKAVCKVDGVEGCSVSLLTGSMTVEGSFSPSDVISSVEKAGYGARLKGEEKEEKKEEKRENGLLKPFFVSLVLLLLLMYVSMGHMLSFPLPVEFNAMARGLYQFILSFIVLLIHRRFFIGGTRAFLHRAPNMDTLVALGSGVSFLYSTVLLFWMTGVGEAEQMHLLHGLYFESAAMITVLITFGKMLEERSKGKTTNALRSLEKLSPSTAHVIREEKEMVLPLEEVTVGDLVVVRPGESIPADSVLVEGEGAVDESALTGESVPVDKIPGDPLYTGTTSLSGKLVLRVEKIGGDTVLSRIIDRVTAASASKAPIARMADKVSAVFVPVVMVLSIITLTTWLLLGEEVGIALSRGISVLVVSCPCALGLATPVAIMVANGVAARGGILFKTAAVLEEAGKTNIVALDKTGTVTYGNMKVCRVIPYENTRESELVSLAASLEEGSAHPIARAVTEYGRERKESLLPVSDFRSRNGFGVEGCVDSLRAAGGKKELVEEVFSVPNEAALQAKRLSQEGKTPLYFATEKRFYGILALSDTIKEDSFEAVQKMKEMGLSVVMLTGDREEVGRYVGKQCGIDRVISGVLPEEKEDVIFQLKKEGKVMMVGDGINDAPALTSADTGVAIGGGMDAALDASQVVLMGKSLSDVPKLVMLSRKTLTNIKENLFWAFCYNLIGIPLAAGVFEPVLGWSLTPMFGAAAMSISSFLVVSNALRLNLFTYGEKKKTDVKKNEKEKKEMEKIVKIEGMMCPHCEAHAKKALEALEGVEEAVCSHEKKEARLRLSADVSEEAIRRAVSEAGYQVI